MAPIQGLSEFLPISSDGHLILVPALLGHEGPDLGTTAVLHIGTLVSVLVYYRAEIAEMLRFTPEGKRLLRFVVIGTIPAAVVGLAFYSFFDEVGEDPNVVAALMIATGVMMVLTRYIVRGERRREDLHPHRRRRHRLHAGDRPAPGGHPLGDHDRHRAGAAVRRGGGGQPVVPARDPGDSRGRSARPARRVRRRGCRPRDSLVVGTVVAGVTGYFAIRFLVTFIGRVGLVPFGIYCIAFGGLSLILL